ncbi:RusA-like resolvase [Microbacterium phage Gingerbug]|nr:RusA-like resolvase [Microbacterium phage Gingerbug]
MLELFIPGKPIQQGSLIPRIIWVGGRPKAVLHSHASADLKRWRTAIATAIRASGHEQIDPYVDVLAIFHMPKPKTTKYPDYPAGTPDLDKLQRALGDALTESGIVADDARIVRWHAMGVWAGGRRSVSEEPGLYLQVLPA